MIKLGIETGRSGNWNIRLFHPYVLYYYNCVISGIILDEWGSDIFDLTIVL